jgi:hypothetical protein
MVCGVRWFEACGTTLFLLLFLFRRVHGFPSFFPFSLSFLFVGTDTAFGFIISASTPRHFDAVLHGCDS